jgi:hypothetical protein
MYKIFGVWCEEPKVRDKVGNRLMCEIKGTISFAMFGG